MAGTLAFGAAFEVASGRSLASIVVSTEALVPFADRILRARTQGLRAEPCPSAVLHRIYALACERKRTLVARLVTPLVAVRGSQVGKFLRYECANGTLDLSIRPRDPGTMEVFLMVDEHIARVCVRHDDGEQDVDLDDFGTGSIAWSECHAGLTVHTYDRLGIEMFHTPWIALDQ